MPPSTSDISHMQLALSLAQKAGRTSPNPPVGAVIVKGQKILAVGYHRGSGKPHAEIEALKKIGFKAKGATLYVTLEPCCHFNKKTPPCTDALIQSGITRVVIGTPDPNPWVNKRGLKILQRHGIKIELGCLKEESEDLIRPYRKWITQKMPYVILKSAITLDGKIATKQGESRWITGDVSRKKAHALRAQADAILVGSETVIQDNPELTVRHVRGQNPIRVILDSKLRLKPHYKIFSDLVTTPTYIATLHTQQGKIKTDEFRKRGIHFLFCDSTSEGRIDLAHLFRQLGELEVGSLLIEGGAILSSFLLENHLVDELNLFIAPKVLGGAGLDLFKDLKVSKLKDAPQFKVQEVAPLGEDLFVRLFPG